MCAPQAAAAAVEKAIELKELRAEKAIDMKRQKELEAEAAAAAVVAASAEQAAKQNCAGGWTGCTCLVLANI